MRNSGWYILALTLALTSCGDGRRDVRDFYFPVRQLTQGQVYEYRAVGNDSLPPVYWYYLAAVQDTGVFLTANYYGSDFVPQQFVREEMLNEGMVLADLYLYEPDSLGRQQQVRAEVLAGSVFPFFVDPAAPAVYLYKVRFQLPSQGPTASTTLIVNRQYVGDTTVTINTEAYAAIRLQLRGVVEVRDTLRGNVEPQFIGEEIYARGLGLVEYWRQVGPQRLHYRLAERYTMQQLEEKASATVRPRADSAAAQR